MGKKIKLCHHFINKICIFSGYGLQLMRRAFFHSLTLAVYRPFVYETRIIITFQRQLIYHHTFFFCLFGKFKI